MRLFKTTEDKEWEARQEKNWAAEFVWDKDGRTAFQTHLIRRILENFPDDQFNWDREVSKVRYNEIERSGILLELTSKTTKSIQIWVYWNMADFKVNGSHLVFEHWDYLDPLEYAKDFIDKLDKEVKRSI
jgi:hypothetical protein